MALSPRIRVALLVFGIASLASAFAVRVRTSPAGQPFLALEESHRTLRILTWNIGNVYLGGHRDSRAADSDLGYIASVIRGTNPDLVALQELRDRRQLDQLLRALGGAYRGYVVGQEVNDRRVAVLGRAGDAVTFGQVGTSTGRAAAVARLHSSAFRLSFVSVHLDAFDTKLRRTQIEELLDWSERSEEKQIILAGDFNFDADFMAEHEPSHADGSLYALLTAHFQDAAKLGASTTIVGRRLDYVFGRGPLKRRSTRVLGGTGVGFMDHSPLVVDYERRDTL